MAARVLAARGDAGASRRAAVIGRSIRLDDDDILRSTRFFRSLLGAAVAQGRTSKHPQNLNPLVHVVESTCSNCWMSDSSRAADRKHGFEFRWGHQVVLVDVLQCRV